ncbi:hypothetical protein B0H14DRAFT_3909352 [Mycena olivaceomarginata]|nr:hypothetical protein B0H14DRAFT_3909352 [Mycena olivaceomarginata]
MRPCRRRSESTKKFMRLTQWWRHIPSFKTNLRSLASLWWSDSTHLASLRDAALWPLYLYSHPHGGMPAPAPLPPAPQAAEAAAIDFPRQILRTLQGQPRRVLTEIGYIPGDNGIKDLDADAWATTKVLALAKARISRQHTAFMKEGCIKPLCDLLTMMDNTVIQVALDGLDNILKVGEMVKVAAGRGAANQYAVFIEEAGGMATTHNLQQHENLEIYKRAFSIMDNRNYDIHCVPAPDTRRRFEKPSHPPSRRRWLVTTITRRDEAPRHTSRRLNLVSEQG